MRVADNSKALESECISANDCCVNLGAAKCSPENIRKAIHMKRHKSLIPLSIALPSLLAVSASGFNNEYTYKYPFPLYDADAASEEGYTEASYQSTTSRDIRRIHQGWNIYNQEWETIYTDVVTGTYVAASYTWNEGCHSDGWSAVWDVDDPESPENDFFSPTKYGFAEVW